MEARYASGKSSGGVDGRGGGICPLSTLQNKLKKQANYPQESQVTKVRICADCGQSDLVEELSSNSVSVK